MATIVVVAVVVAVEVVVAAAASMVVRLLVHQMVVPVVPVVHLSYAAIRIHRLRFQWIRRCRAAVEKRLQTAETLRQTAESQMVAAMC